MLSVVNEISKNAQSPEGKIMRRKSSVTWGLVVLGIVFLSASTIRAGTVIDQEMIDMWGKRSGFVLFYSKKRLRIDQKDGELSTIMDFGKDRIVILHHVSKTYIEYPFSTWEKQVSQKMESQRNADKREIRVQSTGAEKVINGFKTRQIQVFIDGVLFQDNWVTQDVDLEDMLAAIKKGAGRLGGLSKAQVEETEEIYHKIKEWGFPILTTEYHQFYGKSLKEVTEVKRIETGRLNSHLFTRPRGYTQRTR